MKIHFVSSIFSKAPGAYCGFKGIYFAHEAAHRFKLFEVIGDVVIRLDERPAVIED